MAKVLIVDDEPDILLMLRISLEASGYETTMAADGDVALEHIRREPFDVVLLDVMMPVLDGWGVLEALQREEHRPAVIVLSAKSAERDTARALELGASHYVTKPFDLEALIRLVGTTLA